ncbi:hypothetical protein VSH64_05290 [Amycolatopsis rhabdoformis]|uniref:DUF4175 domain-containing protein n=1 Tax=Amycolatopsis rhabdoformis TaxID=1448059 RepID=A0ABZ1ID12_9PSEU|nr:hypothetical protein [Amycolatopsis rhabdoformis]WSE31523.1 hypothetical protein VSH64_05290 [Amycolatopsis rhabdoformis]
MNDRRTGIRTVQMAGLGIVAGLGFLVTSLWWSAATWWTWLGGSLLVGMLTWIFVFELLRLGRRNDD